MTTPTMTAPKFGDIVSIVFTDLGHATRCEAFSGDADDALIAAMTIARSPGALMSTSFDDEVEAVFAAMITLLDSLDAPHSTAIAIVIDDYDHAVESLAECIARIGE